MRRVLLSRRLLSARRSLPSPSLMLTLTLETITLALTCN